jgi:hypothetical protein
VLVFGFSSWGTVGGTQARGDCCWIGGHYCGREKSRVEKSLSHPAQEGFAFCSLCDIVTFFELWSVLRLSQAHVPYITYICPKRE